MSRLEVDKQRFKGFLSQFRGDVPFQIELIEAILADMPDNAAVGYLTETFYLRIYSGPLYVARHAVFKEDVNYFPTYEGLLRFLNGVNKFTNEYNADALLTLDRKTIERRMKDRLPLCGYIITMREEDDDAGRPIAREYSDYR